MALRLKCSSLLRHQPLVILLWKMESLFAAPEHDRNITNNQEVAYPNSEVCSF